VDIQPSFKNIPSMGAFSHKFSTASSGKTTNWIRKSYRVQKSGLDLLYHHSPSERDIVAGILRYPREWNLDSVQSRGMVGMVFMLTGTVGNVCYLWWWRTDGMDSSFKHPHKECEQRVKRWTRLASAVTNL